jgi:hypothetical protein
MANDAIFDAGNRLANRIGSACNLHKINTETALVGFHAELSRLGA